MTKDYKREAELLWKYSHVGCPAASYLDNCAHPDKCAEFGCCINLSIELKATSKPERKGDDNRS